MPRYIDADAFDKVLEFYAAAYSPLDGTKERHVYETIQSCREHIKRAPTADVAPVVRAEWVDENPIEPNPMFRVKICSICGHIEGSPNNFCPSCGAHMKGGAR